MPLQTGSIVEGRYEILRTVRAGGMGAIYEARDLRLPDAPCAVKEMLQEHDGSEVVRRKFEEEVRYLSTLHHPGIPRVRDFFVYDGTCYIVMDFIHGEDLETELKTRIQETGRAFPPKQALADCMDILEVLTYLHGQDPPVIHRDVKPANVIRDAKSKRIRLVDFGIARSVSRGGTTTQTSIGTLAYCPVEQIQGHSEPRSDLYAVGATLYHLLTGQEPPALNVPPLSSAIPSVDPSLEALVQQATAFDAGDRFETAAEMRAALQRWLESPGGVPAAPVAGPLSPPSASAFLVPEGTNGTSSHTRTSVTEVAPVATIQIDRGTVRTVAMMLLTLALGIGGLVLAFRGGPTPAASTSPSPVVTRTVAVASPSAKPSPTPKASPRPAPRTPTPTPARTQAPRSTPPRQVAAAPALPGSSVPQASRTSRPATQPASTQPQVSTQSAPAPALPPPPTGIPLPHFKQFGPDGWQREGVPGNPYGLGFRGPNAFVSLESFHVPPNDARGASVLSALLASRGWRLDGSAGDLKGPSGKVGHLWAWTEPGAQNDTLLLVVIAEGTSASAFSGLSDWQQQVQRATPGQVPIQGQGPPQGPGQGPGQGPPQGPGGGSRYPGQ